MCPKCVNNTRVSPRLRNVLTPVVDLVVEKTITSKAKRPKRPENGDEKMCDGEEFEMVEVKTNVFTHHLEDPDFVHLCYEILARNAPMLRVVVLSNLQKMIKCIKDYLAAHTNDTRHHREFAYWKTKRQNVLLLQQCILLNFCWLSWYEMSYSFDIPSTVPSYLLFIVLSSWCSHFEYWSRMFTILFYLLEWEAL